MTLDLDRRVRAATATGEVLVLGPVPRSALGRLARRAGPREACAFVFGDSAGSRYVSRSVVAVRNTHRSRHSFGIDARVLDRLPTVPLALFHGHAHGLMPSRADLRIFDRMPQLRFQLIGVCGPGGLTLRAFNRINDEIEVASR